MYILHCGQFSDVLIIMNSWTKLSELIFVILNFVTAHPAVLCH